MLFFVLQCSTSTQFRPRINAKGRQIFLNFLTMFHNSYFRYFDENAITNASFREMPDKICRNAAEMCRKFAKNRHLSFFKNNLPHYNPQFVFFKHFLKAIAFFKGFFLNKILHLCLVTIQERFIMAHVRY